MNTDKAKSDDVDKPVHVRDDEDADKVVARIRRGGGRVKLRQSGLEVVRLEPDGGPYDIEGPYS